MLEQLVYHRNMSKCWACGDRVRTGHILCRDDWNRLGSPARKRMRRVIKALQPTESKTVIDRVGLDLDLVRQKEARYQKSLKDAEFDRTLESINWILRDFPNHERFVKIGWETRSRVVTAMHFISGLYSVFETSCANPFPPDDQFILRRPTDEEYAKWVRVGDHAGSTIPLRHILGVEQIKVLRGEGGGK